MKKTTWIIGLTMLISSAVMADISLNFKHTTSIRETAGSGTTITYDFAVDGSGAVTLDASTTSLLANIITSVNSWDGSVGTVADPLLFGTTFQILMTSSSVVTPNRSFTMDGRYSTGMIGVSGNNASRIDGVDAGNDMEALTFTLTSGSPLITLKSFNWDFASTAASLADAKLLDGDTSVTYLDMTATFTGTPSTYGTIDTSTAGLTLGSGANALVFTSPPSTESGTHGYGLSGMTLQIAVVPEPTTTGLLGLGAISILLIRRFKS
jgi:hypothetical protein